MVNKYSSTPSSQKMLVIFGIKRQKKVKIYTLHFRHMLLLRVDLNELIDIYRVSEDTKEA